MNSIKKIKLPAELSKLARAFPVDLFVVGGYVRNQIIGIDSGDIDLCSSLPFEKLTKIATDCGFEIKHKNKTLGTAKLVFGDKIYDYATFRVEKYGDDKSHKPCEVEFIDDLKLDASRRDFTINAIYYNINKQSLTDFYNGFYDLRKGIVRAIGNAEEVMFNDGERILRMIRIAGELNFKIDKSTYNAGLRNVGNLYGINAERIANEISKILYCDKKYVEKGKKSSFDKCLKLLNKMGIWKCLSTDMEKVNYSMVKKCADRTLGLMIDMIDTVNPASVSYFLFKLISKTALSKKKTEQIINIISGYYEALNRKSNKQYFFKYFDNFENIYNLLEKKSKIIAQKYQFFYKYIISYHLVINVRDLDISAKEIKKEFPTLPVKKYNEVLEDVLSDIFDNLYPNKKEVILEEIAKKMTIKKN